VIYTSTVPLTTRGKLEIAGADGAVGEVVFDAGSSPVIATNVTVGAGGSGVGTLRIEDGSLSVVAGELAVGGDAGVDTNTTGVVIMGQSGGGGNPQVSTAGGNTVVGRNGAGTMIMHSGTYTQLSNNLVMGANAGSQATFEMHGGTLNLNGGGGNRNLNFNNGLVQFEQNGGDINVGQDWNLGLNDAGTNVANLVAGTMTIGRNIDFRGSGTDTINLTGGELIFLRSTGAGEFHVDDRNGVHTFNFSGGVLKNVETYFGSLSQQGGVLDVGASAGSMTITSNYTASAAATLKMEIDWDGVSALAVTNYDQLIVQGDVNLNGADLDLTLLDSGVSNAPAGTRFVIIDGASAPIGQFVDGGSVTVDGVEFDIEYGGATGNDVELVKAGSLPTDDDDMDDIPNVLEEAFGTNPNDDASGPEGLPFIRRDGAGGVKVFYRELEVPGDFVYIIESTVDFITWDVEGAIPVVAVDQSGIPAGVDLMEAAFSVAPDGYKAFRVRVDY
jgi:hypothetical protein